MDGLGHSTFEVRVRAVRAVTDGMSVVEVAQAFQTDRSTVYRWVRRYSDGGDQELRRRPASGRPRKLTWLTEAKLKRIVLAPASRFGFETDLWTVTRLHSVLTHQFQESISEDTVWRRLREAGLTWQTPERAYAEADPVKRIQWLNETLPKIKRTVAEYRAILYCQDESTISLTPFLGKTWAERGKPRKVVVTGGRASVAAMSAISPKGHLVFRLHDKRIASAEVIDFLNQLLSHHPKRHLVVVMDQAPPHTSKLTWRFINGQRRLHVFHLPPYSPDWNPDEKVWNHLKNHELRAHQAKNKKELFELTERKLNRVREDRDLLHGLYFRCCVAELLR
jgi:transposase